MKVVCGLGNPGEEYAATRHNVGWWLLDAVQAQLGLPPFRRAGPALVSEADVGAQHIALIKPLTYMNRSGSVLAALAARDDVSIDEDVLVLVDDIALPVGRLRLRAEGSSGGHNGLKSIEAALHTNAYARLRIGVGAEPPGVDRAEWVLSPLDGDDEQLVRAALPAAVAAVESWLDGGFEAARRTLNG